MTQKNGVKAPIFLTEDKRTGYFSAGQLSVDSQIFKLPKS